LQVEYEELGIAQADLVQAGLLSNPVLFSSIRFPKGGEGGNNIEFNIAKEFLDILLRPARRRIAGKEFERAKLRVTGAVLDLAAEVQTAFYRIQGMQQLAEVIKLSEETSRTSYELARQFEEAGNISELRLAQERGAAGDAAAELMRTNAALQSARDQLNRLMGLTDPARNWSLGEKLPQLPPTDPAPDLVETAALEHRLDLLESQREIEQLTAALELTRAYRWIGGASLGVNTERGQDGSRVTGPNFSVEIPVFDQRQAEIARLESLLQQGKFRAEALKAEIQNEVQAAVNHVSAARKLTEYYRDELVPAREQVVKFTQQEQNYMLIDVFTLLFARQQQTQAYRGYLEALSEYWIARAELARTAGTGLSRSAEPPSGLSSDTGQDQPEKEPGNGHDEHSQHGNAM
jgi:Outer membrane protein